MTNDSYNVVKDDELLENVYQFSKVQDRRLCAVAIQKIEDSSALTSIFYEHLRDEQINAL
jgi:hypothetical protein